MNPILLSRRNAGGEPGGSTTDFWAAGFEVARDSITTPTTKFRDVGELDETTYETVVTGGADSSITAKRVHSAPVTTAATFVVRFMYTATVEWSLDYWNGSAWVQLDDPMFAPPAFLDGGNEETWVTLTLVLLAVTFSELRFSLRDSVGAVCETRIGDLRLYDGGAQEIVP